MSMRPFRTDTGAHVHVFPITITMDTAASFRCVIYAGQSTYNKDFNLANESIDLPQDIQPEELKNELHEKIYRLIQYKFAEYLNLLYIVDVPEDQIKKLDGSDIAELAKQVVFLILKREWMKVWFRNKYQ